MPYTPALRYPDPVALLLARFRARAAAPGSGAPTGLTFAEAVPTTRAVGSPPLVVIRRAGGVAYRLQDHPRIDFVCWAPTLHAATALAGWCRTEAEACRGVALTSDLGTHPVSKVTEFAGPQPYPDPAGGETPVCITTHEFSIRGR